MIRAFVFLVTLTTLVNASGVYDQSFDFTTRAVPFGAIFTWQSGYGFPIWGDPKTTKVYGYLRPGVVAQTIGVVNRGEAHFDLFPISILGLRAGANFSQRAQGKFDTVDCEMFDCKGVVTRQFIQAQAMFGVAGFFTALTGRWTKLKHSGSTQIFIDETSSLPGKVLGDSLTTWNGMLGYSVDEIWRVGVFTQFVRMHEVVGNSNWTFAFAQMNSDSALGFFKGEDWTYNFGIGTYTSPVHPIGFSAVFRLKWTGEKGLPLL